MTSNLGSEEIMQSIQDSGEITENAKNKVNLLLKQQFRPEFLNRLDEIILFKPLSKDEIGQIVDLMLKSLKDRLNQKQINLDVTQNAKQFIIDNGYDITFGARPLKRFIQNNVETLVAKFMLANDILPNSTLKIDLIDDELQINIV